MLFNLDTLCLPQFNVNHHPLNCLIFIAIQGKRGKMFPGKRSWQLCTGTEDVLKSALLDWGLLWIVGLWMCWSCFVGLAERCGSLDHWIEDVLKSAVLDWQNVVNYWIVRVWMCWRQLCWIGDRCGSLDGVSFKVSFVGLEERCGSLDCGS